MNYKKVYEALYSLGYHSRGKNHGKNYVKFICATYTDFKSILDCGCSNGLAVRSFRKLEKNAYGLDISETAIKFAAEKEAFVPNCVVSSSTDIIFKDKFVDAIFSCDMLEHLQEKDVYKALHEFRRVAKRYLFLVLDCEVERNKDWIELGKKAHPELFKNIENLHLTVWDKQKWIETIVNETGFNFRNSYRDLHIFRKAN
ncbi:MAG: class I SAM-dependent methyltransferase [Thermoplasmatales archaeon]|nr:MAG: class I SAM-dependent methyltransferase [Thermoplasmatales archaeon]